MVCKKMFTLIYIKLDNVDNKRLIKWNVEKLRSFFPVDVV